MEMSSFSIRSTCALAVIGALAAAAPVTSQAQSASDEWEYTATIYGWLPSFGGNVSIPTGPRGGGGGSASVGVNMSDILNGLNFTFQGMLTADKGRWGMGTDVIYLDLGSSKKKTRDLTFGDVELPVGVTADVDFDMTSWLWTIDGTYLVIDDPDHPMKLLAGARMFDVSTDVKWNLNGDIAGQPLPGRNGTADGSETIWDAIVGVKGQIRFGEDNEWFVPYYLDVGTGDSDLTWQGMLGAGYAFDWGDLVAVWRYLKYDMPSGDLLEDLDANGPAIGVTFHF
jgi:hypothetical protein